MIIKGSNTKVMLQVSEIELDFFIYNITKFILDAKLMAYIEMSNQQGVLHNTNNTSTF